MRQNEVLVKMIKDQAEVVVVAADMEAPMRSASGVENSNSGSSMVKLRDGPLGAYNTNVLFHILAMARETSTTLVSTGNRL